MTTEPGEGVRNPSSPGGIEISLARLDYPIAWADLFGNRNPVEIEIGTGKGRFLIESAQGSPGVNFLGIERSLKWTRFAKERILRSELPNIRLVRTEAHHFLSKFVPPGSVRTIHIYFPDPWPKRRHAKRRFFRSGVAGTLASCLISRGRIQVATDREETFTEILTVLGKGGSLRLLSREENSGQDLPRTHFEAKYLAEGRRIFRAGFRRS